MLEIICNQMSTADLGRFASTSKRVRDVCTAILVARREATFRREIGGKRLDGLFNYNLIKNLIWFDVGRHGPPDHNPAFHNKMQVADGYFGHFMKFKNEYAVIVTDINAATGTLHIYDVLATSTRYLQDMLNVYLKWEIARVARRSVATLSSDAIKRIEFHFASAYPSLSAIERVAWARKQYKHVVGLIRILRAFAESQHLEFEAKMETGFAVSKIRDTTWDGYNSDG